MARLWYLTALRALSRNQRPTGDTPTTIACRVCFINKLDRMGASFERSLASIHERLTPNAVAIQYPVGLEQDFEGVIDLMNMKVARFEGENGENVVWGDVPESMSAIAEEWRH